MPMPPLKKFLTLAAAAVLLGGCAFVPRAPSQTMKAANVAEATGSPFTKYLAAEYRDLANALRGGGFNADDAKHFARKSLAAADGLLVMPEVLADWRIGDKNIVEMTTARVELVSALNSTRTLLPYKAAAAQSRFDCWVVQEETGFTPTGPACKPLFMSALAELQKAAMVANHIPPGFNAPQNGDGMGNNNGAFPPPVTSDAYSGQGEGRGMGTTPLQQATFLVFFDWDKHDLSAGAQDVLDATATELQFRPDIKRITIIGHTDTSGPEKYNRKLSLRRANAVRDALKARGLPAGKMEVEGRGEKELLVQTPDNTREPENRRAEITLQ